MDLGLTDRVLIVSGASGGLGFATASALAADGARLVICSRDDSRIQAAVQRLDAGDRVVGVAADLADPDSADLLVTTATQRFGAVHGAVISVGGPPPGAVKDVDDDTWRTSFESVFLGPLRLARAVLASGGEGTSVTFVLSSSVKSPIGGLGISNGLRPGLAMAAKTLADEYGPQGKRVNVVLPGRIDTDRIKQLEESSGDAAAARAGALQNIPLGRLGTPDEFGRVTAFVTSPAASYLSGTSISVDGGAARSL